MPVRPKIPKVVRRVYRQSYQGAHEIDGSNFPQGESEVDATEGGLPNAVESLREVPEPPPSILDIYPPITLKQGMNVGRNVTLEARAPGVLPTVILDLRTEDDLNSVFTVTTQQRPSDPTSGNPLFALPKFQTGGLTDDTTKLIIHFGAGGCQFVVWVDAFNGQTFCVPGSFLRIHAFNGLLVPVDVGAFVSLLPIANPSPPKYTERFGVLPAGATVGTVIWPFTKRFRCVRAPYASPFTIQLTDNALNIVSEVVVPANSECPWIDSIGSCDTFNLINGGAVNTAFNFVFELAL
jgi:hypothetical protein